MNPKLFNGDADSYLAPENSSPLFLESADQVTIPLVLLADDDASGSLEGVTIGSTLWKSFLFGKIKLARIKHNTGGFYAI